MSHTDRSALIDALRQIYDQASAVLAAVDGEEPDPATTTVAAADGHQPTWPDTGAERADYKDWRYEVGNGDTVLGYRDWVANRDEANGRSSA